MFTVVFLVLFLSHSAASQRSVQGTVYVSSTGGFSFEASAALAKGKFGANAAAQIVYNNTYNTTGW
jgi:hypothetical protein